MTFSDADAQLSVFNFEKDGGYLLWKVWDVIHPGIFTIQDCIGLLHENQSLSQELQRAQAESDYAEIRQWDIRSECLFEALSRQLTRLKNSRNRFQGTGIGLLRRLSSNFAWSIVRCL